MYNGFVVNDNMINGKSYDGNTFKFGITVDKQDYIVKLQKDTISSLYSEHIASRFIRGIGINCHETWLGFYNGQLIVILKDFTEHGVTLRSYKNTQESSEDTDISNKKYTYNDVLYMINKHTKMSSDNKQKAITQFWDMFICDAILGNRDRHRGNWGYLTYKTGYRPAPIYDNGASLFPDISLKIDEYIQCVNNGTEYRFIEQRSEKFPASLFQIESPDGKTRRTNYNEILSDLRINKTLAYEVKTLKEKAGFNQIYEDIIRCVADVKEVIPKEYRRFYIVITCTRYLHLIERKSIKESYKQTIRRLNNEVRNW
jgi:hypothetical protein